MEIRICMSIFSLEMLSLQKSMDMGPGEIGIKSMTLFATDEYTSVCHARGLVGALSLRENCFSTMVEEPRILKAGYLHKGHGCCQGNDHGYQ